MAVDNFQALYVGLDEEIIPRKRRCPSRFEEGSSDHYTPQTAEAAWRQHYFETLDVTMATIKERFKQESTSMYHSLNGLLMSAIDGSEVTIISAIKDMYAQDINMELLETQLNILKALAPSNLVTLTGIAQWLKTSNSRSCLTQVEKLVQLLLTLPATNATSERSFSTLRRIKTYLRGSMGQVRLNSCMILNAYKEEVDSLDPEAIIKEFVTCHDGRRQKIALQ